MKKIVIILSIFLLIISCSKKRPITAPTQLDDSATISSPTVTVTITATEPVLQSNSATPSTTNTIKIFNTITATPPAEDSMTPTCTETKTVTQTCTETITSTLTITSTQTPQIIQKYKESKYFNRMADGTLTGIDIFNYDSSNRLTGLISYDASGNTNYSYSYIYIADSTKPSEKDDFDSSGNLTNRWVFTYNAENLIIRTDYYDENNYLINYYLFSYNIDNKLVRRDDYTESSNTLTTYYLYTYSGAELTDIRKYDLTDTVTDHHHFDYLSGNITMHTDYDSLENIDYYVEYIYTIEGRLIRGNAYDSSGILMQYSDIETIQGELNINLIEYWMIFTT